MNKYRASKLTIKLVPQNIEKAFLNGYHKQGYIKSDFAIGLFNNDELLQIETFGLPRIEIQNKNIIHQYELLRECSKKDCIIYGGKSRLLKHFFAETKCLFLLSYCSLTEGFDGHSYRACGFNFVTTNGSYHYEYNGDIIPRYKMQKNANFVREGKKEKIQATLEKYGKVYDPNKTEKENAEKAGFKFVKDVGNQTWEFLNAKNVGYIYRTTNKVNGKTYIGQHQVVIDGKVNRKPYIGSGILLESAIKKYGRCSFSVATLEWTDDFEKLNKLEEKYIAEERAKSKGEYNIANGGDAFSTNTIWITNGNESKKVWKEADIPSGWIRGRDPLQREHTSNGIKNWLANMDPEKYEQMIIKRNESVLATVHSPDYISPNKGKHHTEEAKRKISEGNKGRTVSEETRRKISEANKDREFGPLSDERKQHLSQMFSGECNPFAGKHHSEETRKVLSTKTKNIQAKRKQEAIEYIHSIGCRTKDDLMKELNLTPTQLALKIKRNIIKAKGIYKGIKYY